MSTIRTDGYAPLDAYAALGDGRAAALVALDGAVDYFAVPRLDAPPACAAILDPDAGGTIRLTPTVDYAATRRYLAGTPVLETTFRTEAGVVRVTDALNVGTRGLLPWVELARRVEVDHGEVPMRWQVSPGNRFGGARPWARLRDGVPTLIVGDQHMAVVTAGVGTGVLTGHAVEARFTARPGDAGLLAVVATDAEPLLVPSAANVLDRIEHTIRAWRQWCTRITYPGPRQDAVVRSALVLKMLTFAPTGALAAAATTSLPEKLGGKRNFDYRFAWVRDASFALDAMARLGLHEEVHEALSWLLATVAKTAPDVRVFYSLEGGVAPGDITEVGEMAGYRHSTPVQLGNNAASQTQLGVYGDLLGAVGRYVDHGGQLDVGTATMLATMADRVCDLWQLPDAGLWELGEPRQYTSSKIGCWGALDQTVRLAETGQLTSPHVERWRFERDAIHGWADEHCWSSAKQAYTFYAGTEELDAAVLLAARTGFLAGGDTRLHTTIDAIRAELCAGGPLLFRYSGMAEKEGAFVACSFWLVEALSHAGRLDDAEKLLQDMLTYANDVGLYSEEIDPASGDLLGNIPQALSHLALIGAATAVNDARADASGHD